MGLDITKAPTDATTSTTSAGKGGGGAAAIAAWAIEKMFAGFSAMGNADDIEKAKTATWDIYKDNLSLLERERAQATKNIQFQYGTQIEDVDIKNRNIVEQTKENAKNFQTGLVTQTDVQTDVERELERAFEESSRNKRNLFETRKLGLEDLSLQFDASVDDLRKERERELAELEGIPDTFFEGMFS